MLHCVILQYTNKSVQYIRLVRGHYESLFQSSRTKELLTFVNLRNHVKTSEMKMDILKAVQCVGPLYILNLFRVQ
jgi:hypothetical protein